MGGRELFSQNLIVESDLQDFASHLLTVAEELGLSPLQLATPLNHLFARLRDEGAGSGHPLAAAVEIDDRTLRVRWGEEGVSMPVARLAEAPAPDRLEPLIERLRQATQMTEPARLLARNREIEQRFEATRQSLNEEIQSIQAELAERQAELQESTRQAETDALTGLLNRRAFELQFDQAYRRARRQPNETLSLMLLDLDYFKEFNDDYGHLYGDEYLKTMAQVMQGATRADVDSAFRIGGDEFAILMWAERDTACRRALEILEQMEGRVSIGVDSLSDWHDLSQPSDTFFEAADNALYAAKEAGRGCLTLAACQRQNGRQGCVESCHSGPEPLPQAQ